MIKIKFAKKVFILLTVLTFVSQSLSSHAFTHSNFSHEVSSSSETHHTKTTSLEMPSSHSHHDMHASEYTVTEGAITLELSGVHGQKGDDHQCCKTKCDCELAHCSTSLALQTNSNSFFAMPVLINIFTPRNNFISIVKPPLIKPPIAA